MKQNKKLSAKSGLILRRISEGHSYGQIVDGNSDIKYPDIFKAAGEVLLLVECEGETLSYEERIARVKRDHPNAYEKWTAEDDALLERLLSKGVSKDEIADKLQRQFSAIDARIEKLELQDESEI